MEYQEFETDEELCQYAVVLYEQGNLKKDVAKILGINPKTLYHKLKHFGFSIYKERSTGLCDVDEQLVLSLHHKGDTIKSICHQTGFTIQDVRKVFKKFSVEPRSMKFYREQYTNKEAFTDTSEEDFPYFYGWLLSDGCYSKGRITLALHTKDVEVLENLKNYVGTRNSIYVGNSKVDVRTGKSYPKCSFTFQDDDINTRLELLGMEERKSTREKCPKVFKYNRHFWRGMIEGDGCISKTTNEISLVGSEEVVRGFGEYCNLLFPECKPKFYVKGTIHVFSLCSKLYSKQILDELYRDCKYKLSRKHEIYLEKYYDGIDTNPAS